MSYKRANCKEMRKCQSWLGIPTLGARAIIINQNNQVLLVKHINQLPSEVW
jgi:hypothetical protein